MTMTLCTVACACRPLPEQEVLQKGLKTLIKCSQQRNIEGACAPTYLKSIDDPNTAL